MGIHTNHYTPVAVAVVVAAAAVAAAAAATVAVAVAVAGKATKYLGWVWSAKDLGCLVCQDDRKRSRLGWAGSGLVGQGIISLGRARPQKI